MGESFNDQKKKESEEKRSTFVFNKQRLAGCVASVIASKSLLTPPAVSNEVSNHVPNTSTYTPIIEPISPSETSGQDGDCEQNEFSLCISSVRGKAEDLDPFRSDAEDLDHLQSDAEETDPHLRLDLEETNPHLRLDLEETDPHLRLDLEETNPHLRLDAEETDPHLRLDAEETDPHLRLDLEETDPHLRLDLEETDPVITEPLKEVVNEPRECAKTMKTCNRKSIERMIDVLKLLDDVTVPDEVIVTDKPKLPETLSSDEEQQKADKYQKKISRENMKKSPLKNRKQSSRKSPLVGSVNQNKRLREHKRSPVKRSKSLKDRPACSAEKTNGHIQSKSVIGRSRYSSNSSIDHGKSLRKFSEKHVDSSIRSSKYRVSPITNFEHSVGSTIRDFEHPVGSSIIRNFENPLKNVEDPVGSPIIRNFEHPIGSPIIRNFENPLKNVEDPVGSPIISNFEHPIENVEDPVGKPITNFENPIENVEDPVGSPIIRNFEHPIGSPIIRNFENPLKNVEDPVGSPITNFGSPIEYVEDPIGSPIKDFEDPIGSPIRNVETAIENVEDPIGSPIKDFEDPIGSPIGNIETAIDNFEDDVGSSIGNVKDNVDNSIETFKDTTKSSDEAELVISKTTVESNEQENDELDENLETDVFCNSNELSSSNSDKLEISINNTSNTRLQIGLFGSSKVTKSFSNQNIIMATNCEKSEAVTINYESSDRSRTSSSSSDTGSENEISGQENSISTESEVNSDRSETNKSKIVLAPAKLTLPSTSENGGRNLEKSNHRKNKWKKNKRKKSCEKSSDMLSAIEEEAQKKRIAQEIPSHNWLENKIRSGDMSIKGPMRRGSTHLPIFAPPQRTVNSTRPVAMALRLKPQQQPASITAPNDNVCITLTSSSENRLSEVTKSNEMKKVEKTSAFSWRMNTMENTQPNEENKLVSNNSKTNALTDTSKKEENKSKKNLNILRPAKLNIQLSNEQVGQPRVANMANMANIQMNTNTDLHDRQPEAGLSCNLTLNDERLVEEKVEISTQNENIEKRNEIDENSSDSDDVMIINEDEDTHVDEIDKNVVAQPAVMEEKKCINRKESNVVESIGTTSKRPSVTADGVLENEEELEAEIQKLKSEIDVIEKVEKEHDDEREYILRIKRDKELMLCLMEGHQKNHQFFSSSEDKKRAASSTSRDQISAKKTKVESEKKSDGISSLSESFGTRLVENQAMQLPNTCVTVAPSLGVNNQYLSQQGLRSVPQVKTMHQHMNQAELAYAIQEQQKYGYCELEQKQQYDWELIQKQQFVLEQKKIQEKKRQQFEVEQERLKQQEQGQKQQQLELEQKKRQLEVEQKRRQLELEQQKQQFQLEQKRRQVELEQHQKQQFQLEQHQKQQFELEQKRRQQLDQEQRLKQQQARQPQLILNSMMTPSYPSTSSATSHQTHAPIRSHYASSPNRTIATTASQSSPMHHTATNYHQPSQLHHPTTTSYHSQPMQHSQTTTHHVPSPSSCRSSPMYGIVQSPVMAGSNPNRPLISSSLVALESMQTHENVNRRISPPAYNIAQNHHMNSHQMPAQNRPVSTQLPNQNVPMMQRVPYKYSVPSRAHSAYPNPNYHVPTRSHQMSSPHQSQIIRVDSNADSNRVNGGHLLNHHAANEQLLRMSQNNNMSGHLPSSNSNGLSNVNANRSFAGSSSSNHHQQMWHQPQQQPQQLPHYPVPSYPQQQQQQQQQQQNNHQQPQQHYNEHHVGLPQAFSNAKQPVPKEESTSVINNNNSTLQSGSGSGLEVEEIICFQCMKKATSVCSMCRSATYCSVQCQEANWVEHENTCKSLSREKK